MIFSKGLFAYQIAIVARPLDSLDHLLQGAHMSSQELLTVYDRKTDQE